MGALVKKFNQSEEEVVKNFVRGATDILEVQASKIRKKIVKKR